ncbi:MAG: flagellin lysine-N-methylase [Clostridia bacterium]|nr:flagellin lysine-N-methylase [Clostridia bacterium]
MSVFAPGYYGRFACIMDKCEHSCCYGWRLSLDDRTRDKYKSCTLAYGERLREFLGEDDEGGFIVTGSDMRCPHLDERGLCRVIIELGEEHLCDICREHPRFYNLTGDRIEVGIGASCPEAARIICSSRDYLPIMIEGHPVPELEVIEESVSTLELRSSIYKDMEKTSFDELEESLIKRLGISRAVLSSRMMEEILSGLEYIDEGDRKLMLRAVQEKKKLGDAELKRIFAYFIYRHLTDCTSEADCAARVGFALFSTRVVEKMSELTDSLDDALRMYSAEVEYSTENTDDAIMTIWAENI